MRIPDSFRSRRVAICALCLAASLLPPIVPAQVAGSIDVPEVDIGANLLEARRQDQLKTVDRFEVFHGFRFTDRRAASKIDFLHQAVDDGAVEYKMVHYDHGNGLAVADVDGDGKLDVYFTNQLGANALWRNRGGGVFEDVTATAGVAVADRISMAASFADYDNDGDPDLFVTTVKMGNLLFANNGKGRFEDVTERAGVGYVGHSSTGVFCDYDRDGWLDLMLTNVGVFTTEEQGRGGYYVGVENAFQGHLMPERSEASILYRNLGDGRFADVTAETGLVDPGWNGDAACADLSGDGYPDIYMMSMQGDDHYWESVEGKRFVDKTAERFHKTPWGSMGIKFFDFDNNGGLDLLLTDMHSDMSLEADPPIEKFKSLITWSDEFLQGGANNVFGNAFYRNRGDGTFDETSDLLGAENYWPWGPSIGDLNADGWEDVFIAASMSFPFRYGINSVLLNNAGKKFLDSEFILGVEPRAGGETRIPWFEIECSGGEDDHRLCAGRTGKYSVTGTLGTRSAAIFDLDDDGDQDIVTVEFHHKPQVLVSNLSDERPVNYLKLRLEGAKSNRSGIGATVRVKVGGRTLMRLHDGKSGYLGQSDMPLYVGLGDATKVDEVEIAWPSGTVDRLTEGIRLNQVWRVREGG